MIFVRLFRPLFASRIWGCIRLFVPSPTEGRGNITNTPWNNGFVYPRGEQVWGRTNKAPSRLQRAEMFRIRSVGRTNAPACDCLSQPDTAARGISLTSLSEVR